MISATLLRLGQDMDFETGQVSNNLVLRLPNGRELKVTVTEESAQEIVQLFVLGLGNGVPSPPVPPPVKPVAFEQFEEVTTDEGEKAFVMGSPEPDSTVMAKAPPPKRKHRLVGKDAAGNPMVEYEGGINPTDVTGTLGGKDEDGVSQL